MKSIEFTMVMKYFEKYKKIRRKTQPILLELFAANVILEIQIRRIQDDLNRYNCFLYPIKKEGNKTFKLIVHLMYLHGTYPVKYL